MASYFDGDSKINWEKWGGRKGGSFALKELPKIDGA